MNFKKKSEQLYNTKMDFPIMAEQLSRNDE